jgi:hypothetical protein
MKTALEGLVWVILNYLTIAFITWDWGANWNWSAWVAFVVLCSVSLYVKVFIAILNEVDDEIDNLRS